MAADPITLERIKLLHPKVRQEVLNAYMHINEKLLGKGVRLRFAYTLRTIEEQDALYKQRPKVTNAKGGQSIHNYGLAFDIVLLYDRDGNGTFESASWNMKEDFDKDKIADWMEVTGYFMSLGWTWGGSWKSFPDAPHFEKTFGHTWKTLKAQLDKKNTFNECEGNVTRQWVNV